MARQVNLWRAMRQPANGSPCNERKIQGEFVGTRALPLLRSRP